MKRLACVFLAMVAFGPPPASAQAGARQVRAQSDWRGAVLALLERRAGAVMGNDKAAFDSTMRLAPAKFKAEKDRWFARVQKLGVGGYRLEVDANGYADLAPALATGPAADEVHVVALTQRFALKGWDREPTADGLVMTVVKRDGVWSIAGDAGLDDLGLLSSRDIWDFGDVTSVVRNGVRVISHGDARASSIASVTAASAARVHSRWPLKWNEPLIGVVPGTSAELQRILGVTFGLGPFVAFTVSSLDRTGARYRLTGSRVYVQPQNFFRDSAAYRNDTLGHELVHLATRNVGGLFTPTWLEEGVAQTFGQSSAVTSFAGPKMLPANWEFTVGSNAEINRAYARAANFVGWMRGRFGPAKTASFYRAAGAESAVSPGTRGYHLDRASRSALGMPFASVVRAWQRANK